MSGILFLLDVIAFLVVVFWAYKNDRSTSDISAKGLLGMKGGGAPTQDVSGTGVPKWKRQAMVASLAGSDRHSERAPRSEPGWKRSLKHSHRP